MSEKQAKALRLNLIKRSRYLIPCSCGICNKQFEDILIAETHVYEAHKDRNIKNVIENLNWDLESDNKNWKILKMIEKKRDEILRALNDNDKILSLNIPKIAKLGKEEYNLKKIIDNGEELDKTTKDKLIDKLKTKITKYMNNLIDDNYLIGEEVIIAPNKRKITKFENELNEIMKLKKAYLLLTDSSLRKIVDQKEEETKEEIEEELPSEEEEEEEEEKEIDEEE